MSLTSYGRAAAGSLAALALLLLARPYLGVQHDGVLYFGQVLRRELIPVLRTDPFFAGGSQDAFSVYSPLLAPLYRTVGPAFTHQALLLAGLLGSAWAVWALLRRMGLQPAWGLLALAVMSPFYGGMRKFSLTENFLTARSLAEPLVLASLLPLMRGQLAWGAALQLGAMALHPLMALPALVLTWLLAVQRDRRWLLLAALPVAGIALGLAGFPPFQRLVAVYDPFWWKLVSTANMQVVLANWTLADGLVVLTDLSLILLASRAEILPEGGQRLLRALALATVGMLAAHVVGADGLQSVLLTQLQLWRVLWLDHVLATVLMPYCIWQAWQSGGLWRLSAALLTLLLMNNHAGSSYGVPLLLGWALTSALAARRVAVSPRVLMLALFCCGSMLLALAALNLSLNLERAFWRPTPWPALDIASRIACAPLLAFGAAGLLSARPLRRVGSQTSVVLLSGLTLCFALWQWDRRGELARAIESPPQPTPFADQIPAEATVFWHETLEGVWGLVQRVSHYDRQQGAGMLFNRSTAELIAPRRQAYAAIREDWERCEMATGFGGTPEMLARCTIASPARLRELCTGPVHPDYLVFEQPFKTPPLATWTQGHISLHLYSCKQFGTPAPL
jgi:hypothetical protein